MPANRLQTAVLEELTIGGSLVSLGDRRHDGTTRKIGPMVRRGL